MIKLLCRVAGLKVQVFVFLDTVHGKAYFGRSGSNPLSKSLYLGRRETLYSVREIGKFDTRNYTGLQIRLVELGVCVRG